MVLHPHPFIVLFIRKKTFTKCFFSTVKVQMLNMAWILRLLFHLTKKSEDKIKIKRHYFDSLVVCVLRYKFHKLFHHFLLLRLREFFSTICLNLSKNNISKITFLSVSSLIQIKSKIKPLEDICHLSFIYWWCNEN